MVPSLQRLKPAVPKQVLLLASGAMWISVGAMLITMAAGWLIDADGSPVAWLVAGGVLGALVIHHFGFLRVVDRNLGRILPVAGDRCLFSFMSWKSYLMVAVMMGMGIALRHSPLPKPELALLYLAIGVALMLSSVRYLRHYLRLLRALRHDDQVDRP